MVYFNPPNHPVDGDERMILTIASRKHEDEPLTAVPTANLRWLLTVKLSPGLAEAVRMELARRGIAPPSHRGPTRASRVAGDDIMTYGHSLIGLASPGPWRS
jgi:hypothetical protein